MSTTTSYALVTGAGSGIGRCIAQALLAQGWTVCLVDVDAKAIASLAAEAGSAALAMPTDITDAQAVQSTFARFAEVSGGRLDLLVNNAGLLFAGNFEDQSVAHITRLLAVNNLGPALCCHAALPYLQQSAKLGRSPAVVNLSSASSVFGIPSMAVYSASKFWVHGFTEALASEWKRHGITVRSVVPPFVNTPMLHASKDHLLMQRLGINLQPEAVAKQVLIAAQRGPRHRAVSWRFKALLAANFVLPKPVMRAALALLAGY